MTDVVPVPLPAHGFRPARKESSLAWLSPGDVLRLGLIGALAAT